jgi:chitin synthase
MHNPSTNHKAAKGALHEDLLTDMVATCGIHGSFVISPTLGGSSSAETNLHLFGVNHYTGSVAYDMSSFVEKNADLVDPALVALVLDSREVFVSKRVLGPTISSETRSKDDSIIVQAQLLI